MAGDEDFPRWEQVFDYRKNVCISVEGKIFTVTLINISVKDAILYLITLVIQSLKL